MLHVLDLVLINAHNVQQMPILLKVELINVNAKLTTTLTINGNVILVSCLAKTALVLLVIIALPAKIMHIQLMEINTHANVIMVIIWTSMEIVNNVILLVLLVILVMDLINVSHVNKMQTTTIMAHALVRMAII